ncbi:hypothetical protein A3B63_01535 [Candidatus Saccharibacteria bacterium RIFCSPLOWO2_01_FULL_49_22]|nr:MAG: hypothetical protein A3B63_01535 [Candidatus Saccharibacteria bacterium RIFCSPLOWO2_01_FULL_49_22]
MEFVRKLVLVLVTPLFIILLFAVAANTATIQIATDAAKIKSIIAKSDIYKSVVPSLLDEAGQISAGGEEVPLNDDVVRQAALATFTPEFIQQNTEAVIDSVYEWLNGETPLPDINVDLTATKADFAANVAAAVEAKLTSLPPCTNLPDNYDPFAATCLPSGVNPASQAATVEENILSGTGFLDHPVITADTIKQENQDQSIFTDELKEFPEVYQKIKVLPVVLGILALMLALAIVLLSSSKRKGLQRVGIMLVVVGIIMLVIAYDLTRLVGEGLEKLDLTNRVLEDSLRTLVIDLASEVGKYYWIFGGAYTALGALAIIWTTYKKPKGGQPDDDGLEGEGQTPEDRIDLKEPEDVSELAKVEEKPSEFVGPREHEPTKPKPKPLPTGRQAKPAAKPPPKPKKPAVKKITVQ